MKLCERVCLLVCLAIITTGCASVDPKPFIEYRDAFGDIHSSADRILDLDYEWTYESFLDRVEKGDVGFSDLVLQFPSPFGWELPDEPLFLRIKNTQKGLEELNKAFADYTTLLADLASGSIKDEQVFDSLATELNDGAANAAHALELELDKEESALFSSAAMALARSFIAKKRRSTLIEIVEKNQVGITRYADHAVLVMELAAEDLKAEYVIRMGRLKTRLRDAPPEKRKEIMEEGISLNEALTAYLETLETLNDGYLQLSRKHAELAESLKGRHYSVRSLIDLSKKLDRQYRELADQRE